MSTHAHVRGTALPAAHATQSRGAAGVILSVYGKLPPAPWDSELACALYFYKQSQDSFVCKDFIHFWLQCLISLDGVSGSS